jgi:excisionase family DNA binding protein
MTFKEACRALGLSRSSFQRKIKSGEIRATRLGEGKTAALTFEPADIGLPETAAPKPEPARQTVDLGPLALDLTGDLPKALPVGSPKVSPKLDCTLEELDSWDIEALRDAVQEWRKPSDPNGPISSFPAEHSSTMPSPANFARWTRANAIIFDYDMRNNPRTPTPWKRYRAEHELPHHAERNSANPANTRIRIQDPYRVQQLRPSEFGPRPVVSKEVADINSNVANLGAGEEWGKLWTGK